LEKYEISKKTTVRTNWKWGKNVERGETGDKTGSELAQKSLPGCPICVMIPAFGIIPALFRRFDSGNRSFILDLVVGDQGVENGGK